MKEMPDNSVDSIVTDPPYELGFMGKSWDASGIAFNVEVWREALRVIKPGGHLIAFSGSRTYHRMAVAIEDAGFEIRDQIMWVYGSGFPKSHNISKGIDKAAGAERTMRVNERWAERYPNWPGGNLTQNGQIQQLKNISGNPLLTSDPVTDEAKQWQGWGTALKPAHEPMVLARKPLIGTVANNVLTYGTGGLNIDGSRVAHLSEADRASATPQGKVTSNKLAGAAPDVDDVGRVEVERPDTSQGRWPANFIHDGSDEVVALFPEAKGKIGMKILSDFTFSVGDKVEGAKFASQAGLGDSGSAARFFYCAKASKRDRNEGLEGFEVKRSSGYGYDKGLGNAGEGMFKDRNPIKANHHPTVKPTALMQYLVRLVTPPNGIVLDPFMGSGSTGKACAYENFDFIGIDQSAEYVEIARARIFFAIATNDEKLPL
jgi:site-specific DNA-methyltransferase (adenine-specific)